MPPVPAELFYCVTHTLKNVLALSLVGELHLQLYYVQHYFSIYIYVEPENEVNTIDVSITGDYLVTGGKDATVRIYNAQSTKVNIIKYLLLVIILDKLYICTKFLLKYEIHNNIFIST